MNKKLQTVYIPIKAENDLFEAEKVYNFITEDKITFSDKFNTEQIQEKLPQKLGFDLLKSTEAYVFTPEELKQLLEEYTSRIVENTHICLRKYPTLIEEDFGQEITTERENEYYGIHKESITSQLPKFLKEKGYE